MAKRQLQTQNCPIFQFKNILLLNDDKTTEIGNLIDLLYLFIHFENMASSMSRVPLEPGEQSLLQRDGVQCKFSGKTIKRVQDRGTLYITTSRMIFVPNTRKNNREFWEANQGLMSVRFSGRGNQRTWQSISTLILCSPLS